MFRFFAASRRFLCLVVAKPKSSEIHISTGIYNVIYTERKRGILEIFQKRYIYQTLYILVDPCKETPFAEYETTDGEAVWENLRTGEVVPL